MNRQEDRTYLSNISDSQVLGELQNWTDSLDAVNPHAQVVHSNIQTDIFINLFLSLIGLNT